MHRPCNACDIDHDNEKTMTIKADSLYPVALYQCNVEQPRSVCCHNETTVPVRVAAPPENPPRDTTEIKARSAAKR